MDRVASGIHAAGDQDDIADFQRADLLVGDRRLQPYFAAGPREAGRQLFRRQHRHRGRVPLAIEPLRDRAGPRVQRDAEAAEGPAVVGDGNEEARRQPVERADLAADQRRLAAEPHRPDRQLVGRVHDRVLDLREPRIRVRVVERAEQLLLRMEVARRAVAADADADGAGAASLALRLPHGVEDALAHAVEGAVGAPEVIELRGQRVLRVGVLAAASLQDQLHLDGVLLPLLEVHDRRPRAEVVARVLTRDRIDRVGPQLAAFGRFRDRGAHLLFHPDLVDADRHLDLEGRHAGVLANGPLAARRLVDVLGDDRQRLAGPGRLLFRGQRRRHGLADVGRQVGGGAGDELHDAVEEGRKHTEQYNSEVGGQRPEAGATRVERDPLGELHVPADAYYGVQTQRAVENFPISGLKAPAPLVTATVLIKQACARANGTLARLDPTIAGAIVQAADEILAGALRDQFIVDVYQAGAGTSHNMNTNEVLANRAGEILGEPRGTYARVHPNDHVNMGQSTNDVFPTATRLAILLVLPDLLAAAIGLADALEEKSQAFARVLKTGRTHLQDAVPITLGQEFSGYAANVRHAAEELNHASSCLYELNLGATALGTGLNAGTDFTQASVTNLVRATGLAMKPARNRFRVTQSMGDVLTYSAACGGSPSKSTRWPPTCAS